MWAQRLEEKELQRMSQRYSVWETGGSVSKENSVNKVRQTEVDLPFAELKAKAT
jgi:hypothetical protein